MKKETKPRKGQIVVITINNGGNYVGAITKIVLGIGNRGLKLDKLKGINKTPIMRSDADILTEARTGVIKLSLHYCKRPVWVERGWRSATRDEKKAYSKGLYMPASRKIDLELTKGDSIVLLEAAFQIMEIRKLEDEGMKLLQGKEVIVSSNYPEHTMIGVVDPRAPKHELLFDYVCINSFANPPITFEGFPGI